MRLPYKNRHVIIVGSAGFIVLVVVVVLMLGIEPSGKKGIKILSDNVDLEVRDVVYSDVGNSGLKWEIKADTAKYIRNEHIAIFDHVTVKVFMQDGRTFVMTGNNGRVNTETKDMEIHGNVSIVSNRGDNLTTDILQYTDKEQRFHTDSVVIMKNSGVEARGAGLSLSLKGRSLSMLSKVKARINKHGK